MNNYTVTIKNISAGLPKAKLADGESHTGIYEATSSFQALGKASQEMLDGCGLVFDGATNGYSDGAIYQACAGRTLYGRVWAKAELKE